MNDSSLLPAPHVLILAAGFSSRLGSAKSLARIRAQSLLRRTLVLAARFAPPQIVVVVPRLTERYRTEARGLKVVFVANRRRAQGLSSSVRRGISRARYSSALLLLPVDLAALRADDIARLISRWRAHRRCVIARRIAAHGGSPRGGVPVILPRRLYCRAGAVTGDMGLRELVAELPAQQRVLVDLDSASLDVDTLQDLRAARRRLRRR